MASRLVYVDLTETIGALQIGSTFSVFLFGILTLQAHFYYTTFSKDRWSNKALVTVIWLLELAHTGCVSYEVYRDTITLYGQPQLLVKFPGLEVVTILGGIITWLTHCFFANRIYRLFPRPYNFIGVFCAVAATVRVVGSAYLTAGGVRSPTIAQYRKDYKWLVAGLLGGGAAIDIIIAVSMLSYLISQRGKGFSRLAKFIDKLIGYTVRTGLLTSLSAVTMLIMFQTMPENLMWLAVYTFLAKLYSNSLLSALNARHSVPDEMGSSIDPFSSAGPPRTASSHRRADVYLPGTISIEMKTTTEYSTEDSVLPTRSKSTADTMSNSRQGY